MLASDGQDRSPGSIKASEADATGIADSVPLRRLFVISAIGPALGIVAMIKLRSSKTVGLST